MPLRDYQQEALDALENYIAIEDGIPWWLCLQVRVNLM
jgi:hypothetical protein